jgi:hypothetical protein
MDIERALRFHFEDQDWLKQLLIGGVVGAIPIVGMALYGYGLRVLKNVTQEREVPLPDWNEFGDYFVKGLLSTIGALIYTLPLIVLACLVALIEGSRNADSPSLFTICFGCLSGLYGLLIGVLLPAAYTKYAVSEEFAVFFHFRELFKYIADNLGNYILALLVGCVAVIAAGIVGGIFCGVGMLLTMPWSSLVWAHLLAQVYRADRAKVAGI